jgi:aryl-alcohol dehydrogenase-like predicted oxidoreductase
MAAGGLRKPHSVLADLAQQWGATPNQLALAWLLHRSPVILPIPGTSSVAHLDENLAAASIHLSDAQFEALTNKTLSA